ncbi:Sodium/hydrogen exchanger 9B2 [Phlyctochytrium bullatum]|nr:Sodium/hydrogen exchanger 9B2 [Phlyctochytrium bullatum]
MLIAFVILSFGITTTFAAPADGDESDQANDLKPAVAAGAAVPEGVTKNRTADAIAAAAAAAAAAAGSPNPPSIMLLISLVLVVLLGVLGGRAAERLKQSPMLGMLLAGVLSRNLLPTIILPLPHSWTAQLWTVALSAVVSRAGLSLQIPVIRPNLVPTMLLGSIPVICEAVFLAWLVQWVFGLPPEWSYTLSFGVAPISPGVVVPLLLNLLERPAWHGSRIPPLLLAATGLDVLIATTCFGVSIAAIFGHRHESKPGQDEAEDLMHASWVARAAEEIFFGVGGGMFFGFLAILLRRTKAKEPWATGILFTLTTGGMMYLKMHGFPGAASASVIIAWAFVSNSWEKEAVDVANKRLKLVWKFAEPFLFPLIGASVSLMEMRIGIIAVAMLCIALSILFRMTIGFIISWIAGLSAEEQIFTCGLLTGKASVQAALSTVTMELVHRNNLQGTIDDARSRIVFACMVASILLGAPFAASWVSVFGGRAPSSGRGIIGIGVDAPLAEAKKESLKAEK